MNKARDLPWLPDYPSGEVNIAASAFAVIFMQMLHNQQTHFQLQHRGGIMLGANARNEDWGSL